MIRRASGCSPSPSGAASSRPDCLELEVVASVAHGPAYTTDHLDCAATWSPPAALHAREVEAFVAEYLRVAQKSSDRVVQLFEIIDEHHPSEPHYTLENIGVRPEGQGRGLGALLVAPVLARCDREQVPAFVASANPRNLAFYQRHGSEITGESSLPDGTQLWHMLRKPRPATSPTG